MSVAPRNPDFTGYWRLVKTENFNNFLKDLGLPWTVRKAALRFGSASVDLISHTGTTVKVTSLCAKGSWTREYDTAAAIKQRNAQGEMCATNARWEGSVLVSTMEGSPLGVATSARFMAGPTMVVKTAVRLASGRDAIMFWIFDRMQAVEERVSGPGGRPLLLRQLAADHAHVARATRRDNAYLQDVLLDWARWRSPADDFIQVPAPAYTAARPSGSARTRRGREGGATSPPPRSPRSLGKSPSDASLTALGAAQDAALRAVGAPPNAGAAAAAAARLRPGSRSGSGLALSEAAGAERGGTGAPTAPEPSVSGSLGAAAHPGSETLSAASQTAGGGAAPAAPAAGLPPLAGGEPLPALRTAAHHAKSLSSDSRLGGALSEGGHSTPVRGPSPRPSAAHERAARAGPAIQQQLAHKLVEFCEGRGISSVVPLASPGTAAEPQLLGMSPEQAEETAAKMSELEADMLLARQGAPRGWACCGLIVTRRSTQIPDHLRVWEMNLAA
ncbi:hypothetical protein ACKKBG_A36530 [Auxenochlorella protothecoides x Auxenochlorella symbiontica]